MARLEGKVAVVTGGSRGIGAAIARRLAKEGASVVVNYARSGEAADRLVDEICQEGGRAVAVKADLSRPEEATLLVDRAVEAFGRIDVLVNNAGTAEFASIDQADAAHIERQFALNVTGLLHVTREAVARIPAEGGSVINISSVVGRSPMANAVVYSATKAAVDAITIGFARELGPRKVRVNGVAPGPVETDMWEATGKAYEAHLIPRIPLGRIGRPEEIADAVAFLASDEARLITGQTLGVDGGIN